MKKCTRIGAIALVAAMVSMTGLVQADYPEKPVEFIVPWPPGDLEDVLTRRLMVCLQR